MIDDRSGAAACGFAPSRAAAVVSRRGRAALACVALAAALPAAFQAGAARAATGVAGRVAAQTPLEVRDIKVQARHTFGYTCASGATFKVTYFNAANGQSFALVPVDGRKLLFVGVIAASGVRYVADRYTWWTKGPGADLYDTTSGDSAKPVIAGCATIMR